MSSGSASQMRGYTQSALMCGGIERSVPLWVLMPKHFKARKEHAWLAREKDRKALFLLSQELLKKKRKI